MTSTGTSTTGTDILADAYRSVRESLLAEMEPEGYWHGELSSSALATATAVSALKLLDLHGDRALVAAGVDWLGQDQNPDGGWGDTPDSPSNPSTTMLVQSALSLAGGAPEASTGGAERYLCAHAGTTTVERAQALCTIYGADRTFSAPILMNAALAAERGDSGTPVGWDDVPALPFELACCPRRLLRTARAQVVSYALPALIAIGQLIHVRNPTRNPVLRLVRSTTVGPTLRRLERLQPASGGFLEAVPLTSFVTMSLAAMGRAEHPVAGKGAAFLRSLVRSDGSWPVDSDLSTWLTTMAVCALCEGGREPGTEGERLREWILACQHRQPHLYTGSEPGGWAWTSLSGGVPDVDDTSSALLALAQLRGRGADQAATEGIGWLLGVQNADGGWPTFCRGWGRLPFDRSAPDLTAHALRAILTWSGGRSRASESLERGFRYLGDAQRPDGAWVPLWFGHQQSEGQLNPVYGTARVLRAYWDAGRWASPAARRGVGFLLRSQGADGGWGAEPGIEPSVEETALAVCALRGDEPGCREARARGARYMAARVQDNGLDKPAPIGLYFAKLWYSEKLYPLIWTVAALGSVTDPSRPGRGG